MQHQDSQSASEVVEVLKALPQHTLQVPLIYLSSAQRDICLRNPVLAHVAPHLPGWVSHRTVALALGHGQVDFDHSCILVSSQSRSVILTHIFRTALTLRFAAMRLMSGPRSLRMYAQNPLCFYRDGVCGLNMTVEPFFRCIDIGDTTSLASKLTACSALLLSKRHLILTE